MYDPPERVAGGGGGGVISRLPERIVTSRCHVVLVHSLDQYMHFEALDPQPRGSVCHFLGRGLGTLRNKITNSLTQLRELKTPQLTFL